jgi:hypothetical protein
MTVRWAVIIITDAGEEEVSDIKQMEEGTEPELDETTNATAEEVADGVEIGMIRGGPVGAVGGFGWRDPDLSAPNATTVADAEGNWGFTGDTPATLGDVTWTVRSGGSEASVNIHVGAETGRKTLKRKE